MKKILFMIDSLTCGGAEKSLVSLLPLLNYSKFEVELMMTKRGGVFETYIPQDVHIISLPKATGFRKVWSLLCRLYFSLLLRIPLIGSHRHGAEIHWMAMKSAYIPIKKKYDVAIAYQQGFPTYYVATKIKADKKYAWINCDLKEAGYKEYFNRKFYSSMSRIIAVSDSLSKMLRETRYVNTKKLVTIYDIVNVELVRKLAQEGGFEDVLPKSTLKIVTVGRMVFPKNYLLAIETAKNLKEKGLQFRWYFVGDGDERVMVESLINKYELQNEVHLLGMKPNPYPYMKQCDVYVQTSRFEGFGLTISEAKILGKPIVSTNFNVVYNQITSFQNGIITEMNAESVASGILRLSKDACLTEKIKHNLSQEHNKTYLTEIKKVEELIG